MLSGHLLPAILSSSVSDGQLNGASGWLEFWPILTGVIVFAWGVREWIYGGSVLRVKLELGYTDGIQSVRAAPHDFAEPGKVGRLLGRGITNPAIDVAYITVTNHGRTAATVLNPGLRFTMRGVDAVFIAGIQLGDLGVAESRVRLEAHDSCVFVIPLGAVVRAAKADTEFQKAQGENHPMFARAQVTSGTGRAKRSCRIGWGFRDGRWAVRLPLRGKALRIEEELVDTFVYRDRGLYDQFLDAGVIVNKIRAGESDADILNWIAGEPTQLFTRAKILARARHIVTSEP